MSWSGCPINGVAFGLFDGDDDGDNVQKIKFVTPLTYWYLTVLVDVFVVFCTTGSQ